MDLPKSENLSTEKLGRLFDNKSECYKLFWFNAIFEKAVAGKTELYFDDLINHMICDAWYMVSEFHLNLGPKDALEQAVKFINTFEPKIPSTIKKQDLLDYLKKGNIKEVNDCKKILIQNVPVRLHAPFVNLTADNWGAFSKSMTDKLNSYPGLIYYFTKIDGLYSIISIPQDWAEYFIKNQEIIRGWIQYNMISYLQRRNPDVPGIPNKLIPPLERKLSKVIALWKKYLSISPVNEIYANMPVTTEDISIDHFIPWSYCAHDELWNLHPTTRSINSSKSNHLPSWDLYFPKLADLEFNFYKMIWNNPQFHKDFDICAKDHLNNLDIKNKLFDEENLIHSVFTNRLKDVLFPIYQSAKNCGFDANWEYNSISNNLVSFLNVAEEKSQDFDYK